MKKLPLFKTHFSLGKSILTVDKPTGDIEKKSSISVLDLVLNAKLDSLTVVEDCMTGLPQIREECIKNKLKLVYGLRLEMTQDCLNQDEKSLKSRAKYIIFAKNNAGHQQLIKIWSFAAKEGFYYNPVCDFVNLKRLWNDNLILCVPFYDSFLHLNSFEGNIHVPVFSGMQPIFFLEENALPFDPHLRVKVLDYCAKNGYETVEAQSIYYKSKSDFVAWLTFKSIHSRTTIEKPEANHCSSDTFCYDRWLEGNIKV